VFVPHVAFAKDRTPDNADPYLQGLLYAGGYADLIDVNNVASGILVYVKTNHTMDGGPTFVHHSGERIDCSHSVPCGRGMVEME
jgi:hypothetical protein